MIKLAFLVIKKTILCLKTVKFVVRIVFDPILKNQKGKFSARAQFPEDMHDKFEIVQFSFSPLQLGGGLIFNCCGQKEN